MRPIARPKRKSRNAIFPDIPWRGRRKEKGKKRERLLPRLNIGAPTSSFYLPFSARSSSVFRPGNPAVLLPLPLPLPAGGTYLTTVICISILLKRKYLIKLAGNVVSRRRRGRMPDPPYRNFPSQFILSIVVVVFHETWNIHPDERFVGSNNSSSSSFFF